MADVVLNDANNDGTGIDVLEYFASWEETFVREYWGFFSNSATDFVGRQFAFADSAASTVGTVGSADTVVVDSGTANGLQYDYTNHVLAGAVDGITFGAGLGYSSTSDTFSQTSWDIDISGLGVTGTGANNAVHNLVWALMNSDTSTLLDVLDSQNNTFTSSTGDDVLYGFANQDTFIFEANWAEDTIIGFDDGQDLIDLSAFGFDNLSDFTSSGGSVSYATDTVIAYAGNTITIDGGTGTLTNADFVWA